MVTQEARDRSEDRTEIPYSAHWTITLNILLDDLYQLKCDIVACYNSKEIKNSL